MISLALPLSFKRGVKSSENSQYSLIKSKSLYEKGLHTANLRNMSRVMAR